MISDAKNTSLFANSGTLPNVQDAMANWFQLLSFYKVQKKVVNFLVEETLEEYTFQGVKQPLSPQKLSLKPEGQRAWIWITIHAYPDLILKPDEIIQFGTTKYRVMEKLNWKEYGYVEYHAVEDYQ